MATKHTPRPWKVSPGEVGGTAYGGPQRTELWIVVGENIIATIDPATMECPPEYEANAALIAAAPELLEALTALGVMPDGYCFCHQNRDPLKAEKEHTGECRDARAAIAKAEPS